MSEQELKPCPFCGEPGEYDSGHYDGRGIREGGTGSSVYCSSQQCPYFTHACSGEVFDTKEEAIEAWNTRADTRLSSAPEGLRDEIKVMKESAGSSCNCGRPWPWNADDYPALAEIEKETCDTSQKGGDEK
jgi:hypothetical protein